ncbi:DUF2066 domain-containing protein [Roseospirillum parvum]|uniref:DUF2066 domain-containing protein n=1 Tax=Roseospirillum parvum TaxID=83401 RepID=UPI001FDF7D39|nr:DUF2066 domain-containing protein [Roseospirillum parvum]
MVLGLLLASGAARASGELFTVGGITVDVTADDVGEARQRAIAEGQAEAARVLMARLTRPADHERLPLPEPGEVVDMVRDFSIADEKTSDVRYIAELTVSFDPEAIAQRLRMAGLPFVKAASPPLLVVPLYQPGPDAAWVLWDEPTPNPWRQAWLAQSAGRGGFIPLVVPFGDLTDLATLSPEQAAAGEAEALAALAERYEASQVLIARAQAAGGALIARAEGPRFLAGPVSTERPLGDDPAQAMEDVAGVLIGQLAAAWKARNLIDPAQGNQLTALAQVDGFEEWLTLRQRLDAMARVDYVQLQALTPDRAQLTLYYRGEPMDLTQAMRQNDLDLMKDGDYWILATRERAEARTLNATPPAAN